MIGLGALDWAVLAASVVALILLTATVAGGVADGVDFQLGGRRAHRLPLIGSLLSVPVGVTVFTGVPAFAALQSGGATGWLARELGVPLAVLFVAVRVLPALRSVPGSSVYAFLHQQFGVNVGLIASSIFLVARVLATALLIRGVGALAGDAVGASAAGVALLIGLTGAVLAALGGMRGALRVGLVQAAMLWAGTVAASAVVMARHGGTVLAAVPRDILTAVPASSALAGGAHVLGTAVSSAFLYASAYSCDQRQAQRLLSAPDTRAARQALIWTGVLRIPFVAPFAFLGILLAGLLRSDAGLSVLMLGRRPEHLLSVFAGYCLPEGARGLVAAGLVTSALSAVTIALLSLSAVSLDDVAGVSPSRQRPWLARLGVLGWGVVVTALACLFGAAGLPSGDAIGRLAVVASGPMLALFLLGIFARRATPRDAVIGLSAGLFASMAYWRLAGIADEGACSAVGTVAGLVPLLWRGVKRRARTGSRSSLRATRVLLAAFGVGAAALWLCLAML
jgi:Na+/proline symporter